MPHTEKKMEKNERLGKGGKVKRSHIIHPTGKTTEGRGNVLQRMAEIFSSDTNLDIQQA